MILSTNADVVLTTIFGRLTSFPILLTIAYYERQAKRTQATTFTEAVSATAERVVETLPRSIKRLSTYPRPTKMYFWLNSFIAFFEGLFAGKASDIDVVRTFLSHLLPAYIINTFSTQIFDIENEFANYYNTSALEMQDLESTPSLKATESPERRRISQVTERTRRFSGQSSHRMDIFPSSASSIHSANSPTSNHGDSNGDSRAHRSVRQRLTSFVQRSAEAATNFTSPLAQLYQPLVVDDDLVEEDDVPAPLESSPTQTKPSANFIAQRRRRLSSMHRFPPLPPAAIDAQRQGRRDGHHFGEALGGSPLSFEGFNSPEEHSKDESGLVSPTNKQGAVASSPKPVSRVVARDTITGSGSEVSDRLAKIEENQKRLEELILNLTQSMSKKKK